MHIEARSLITCSPWLIPSYTPMRGAEMSKVQGEAINVQVVFINAQT